MSTNLHNKPETGEVNPYFEPATTEEGLYVQIQQQKLKIIRREAIKIQVKLGKGHFGTVARAIWDDCNGMIYEVAVKSLTRGTSGHERVKLLREAATMGQFCHPNVLQLYGVVVGSEEVMVVMEIAHKGDLKQYLHTFDRSEAADENNSIKLFKYSTEIAEGMSYLSCKGFVHRDLAARNILLTAGEVCKIGDFGMSRDLDENAYYISTNCLVPIKWTAPEAILDGKYSTSSDVWSYGCVLYEIWSLGKNPYQGIPNSEVLLEIEVGNLPKSPERTPTIIAEVMSHTWERDPHRRPTFKAIVIALQQEGMPISLSEVAWNTSSTADLLEEQSGSKYYKTTST